MKRKPWNGCLKNNVEILPVKEQGKKSRKNF
jgi:hypothetical protein